MQSGMGTLGSVLTKSQLQHLLLEAWVVKSVSAQQYRCVLKPPASLCLSSKVLPLL